MASSDNRILLSVEKKWAGQWLHQDGDRVNPWLYPPSENKTWQLFIDKTQLRAFQNMVMRLKHQLIDTYTPQKPRETA